MREELAQWVRDQRALARALGLTIEEWILALERASKRRTGLTAAVIGAATARKMGLGILAQLDGPKLYGRAKSLIDPEPPRPEHPVLREVIRRADELPTGGGAGRLKKAEPKDIKVPVRGEISIGESASVATPDAPGRGKKK